jgi:hypothetical protein
MQGHYLEYLEGKRLVSKGVSFRAALTAAILTADPLELSLLKEAFPDTYQELLARHNRARGLLANEEMAYAGTIDFLPGDGFEHGRSSRPPKQMGTEHDELRAEALRDFDGPGSNRRNKA